MLRWFVVGLLSLVPMSVFAVPAPITTHKISAMVYQQIPYTSPDDFKSFIIKAFDGVCGPNTFSVIIRDNADRINYAIEYYSFFSSDTRFVLASFGRDDPRMSSGIPLYVWFGHLDAGKLVVDSQSPYDAVKHEAGPCSWFLGA